VLGGWQTDLDGFNGFQQIFYIEQIFIKKFKFSLIICGISALITLLLDKQRF